MYNIPSRSQLIFLLLLSSIGLFGQDLPNQRLEWDPIEGAIAYKIEIRRGYDEILNLESPVNYLNLSLPMGEYQYRVGVMDKFGNFGNFTEWKDLIILRADHPQFLALEPNRWYDSAQSYQGQLRATGINPGARLFFESGNIQIPLVYNATEDTLWEIQAQRPFDKRENWDLRIINPSGLELIQKDVLQIDPYLFPEINRIEPGNWENVDQYQAISIEGEGFEEGCKIILHSDEKSFPLGQVEYISSRKIISHLNFSHFPLGFYRMEIQNPNGESFLWNENLEIKVAPEIYSEVLPKDPIAIGITQYTQFPLGELQTLQYPSPLSGILQVRGYIGNSLTKNAPILKNLALGIGFQYSYPLIKPEKLELQEYSIHLRMYYLLNPGESSPYLSLGLGEQFSYLTNTLGAESKLSLDTTWFASAGFQWKLGDSFFLDGSVHFRQFFGVSREWNSLGIGLGGGFWIK